MREKCNSNAFGWMPNVIMTVSQLITHFQLGLIILFETVNWFRDFRLGAVEIDETEMEYPRDEDSLECICRGNGERFSLIGTLSSGLATLE